jgi:ABC-type transport system involved in multi-copper enzyme maturation permease subunit
MLTIAKHQLKDGLRDSKFLFVALVVLLAFAMNGYIFAERYKLALDDWNDSIADTTRMLESKADNLQEISTYPQRMAKPPSVLAFIGESGEEKIPNRITVNGFICTSSSLSNRGNEMFQLIQAVDWTFIVGTIMTLLALLLSFGTVCGEKRDGTLRQVLSYPLSRINLLFGKYLGSLLVITITLVLGIAVSLSILSFSGALPIDFRIASAIGWSFTIALFYLSLILLAGITVSSMVHRPEVALVVLMIFWLVCVFAVPGLARLLGESLVPVPSELEVDKQARTASDEIWHKAPRAAGEWSSDSEFLFTPGLRDRASMVQKMISAKQKIWDGAESARIRQAETIQALACVSPTGLLGNALQSISGTGTAGYKDFREMARIYNQQVHSFTVAKDKNDPATPHLVYSWGIGIDEGTFSTKPVSLSEFPRWHTMWAEGGLPRDQPWPVWQLVVLIVLNLQMAMIAFIALARYDPR